MTFDTMNPVPSSDPRDIYDNSEAFDRFLMSAAASEPDRLGVLRKTWKQMEADAAALVSPNVSALAAAVSAANKLFYYTGSGTGAMTDFTAQARTLLAASTQAAQRTALGLGTAAEANVTTSSVDTTAAALMKVGDFGLGSAQVPTITDANSPTATGDYRITGSGANVPITSNGLIRHVQYSSTVAFQLWMTVGSYSNGMYWRSIVSGAGNAWLKIAQDSVAGSALAALTPAANSFPYWTSASAAANATLTAGMRAMLGLTAAANQLPYLTSATAAALTTLSAFARTLLDDADAATARATLGVLAQTDKPAWTSYTPTVTASSGTYTSISATGKYIVLFGICHVQITLTITTVGTGTFPIVTLPAAALAGSAGFTLNAKANAVSAFHGGARITTGLTAVAPTRYDNGDFTAAGEVVLISGSYPVA